MWARWFLRPLAELQGGRAVEAHEFQCAHPGRVVGIGSR
jgi:hypothetical protein